MSNPNGEKTIDAQTLRRYVADGLTLDQMVQRFKDETGLTRARSSFSAAMHRFDIKSAHPRSRYKETLPWRVKQDHIMLYEARMLRLLGRRKRNLSLKDDENTRLDGFLRELDQDGKVVHYDPQTPQGFWFVEKLPTDTGYIRQPLDS